MRAQRGYQLPYTALSHTRHHHHGTPAHTYCSPGPQTQSSVPYGILQPTIWILDCTSYHTHIRDSPYCAESQMRNSAKLLTLSSSFVEPDIRKGKLG
jgi:hypothetical protein